MEIVVLFLLALVNGFFALMEIAFVSSRKSTLEHLASQGNHRARSVIKLLKNPEHFLSSIQIGITLIGIISGVFGGIALTDDFEQLLSSFEWLQPYHHEVAIIVVVGTITFISIIIGELVPKSIALNNAETIALASVPFIKIFTQLTYPLTKVLSEATALVLRVVGVKERKRPAISEEELRFLLKAAGNHGVLPKDESDVHDNLFYFSDQVAHNLMTPKQKLEWIDLSCTNQQILEQIKNSIHSKFPACVGSVDQIKGVITSKDFLENFSNEGFDPKDILIQPIFFHRDTPAFNILGQFKQRKQYLGFIKDESGKIVGIITLKDLMEAIVGDLPE